MSKIDKVLFTGKTHTTATRASQGGHGNLDVRLSSPNVVEEFTDVQPHMQRQVHSLVAYPYSRGCRSISEGRPHPASGV